LLTIYYRDDAPIAELAPQQHGGSPEELQHAAGAGALSSGPFGPRIRMAHGRLPAAFLPRYFAVGLALKAFGATAHLELAGPLALIETGTATLYRDVVRNMRQETVAAARCLAHIRKRTKSTTYKATFLQYFRVGQHQKKRRKARRLRIFSRGAIFTARLGGAEIARGPSLDRVSAQRVRGRNPGRQVVQRQRPFFFFSINWQILNGQGPFQRRLFPVSMGGRTLLIAPLAAWPLLDSGVWCGARRGRGGFCPLRRRVCWR